MEHEDTCEARPHTRESVLAQLAKAPESTCEEHVILLKRMRSDPFTEEAARLHEALVFAASYRLVPTSEPALRDRT